MSHPKDLSWRVESIRLSLFVNDLPANAAAGWWEELTGQIPEETSSKRSLGEFVDQGPYEDGRLWLGRNSLAKRIDWIVYAGAPIDEHFPGLYPMDGWVDKFQQLMTRWLETAEINVFRIAYGAVFVAPVESSAEGYDVLNEALPMIKFEEDWTEFSFQVNKPQPLRALQGTTLEGTLVNCLSKWNSVQLNFLPLPSATIKPLTRHAARIELDLNTSAEHQSQIDSGKIANIVNELGQLAMRYTKEGFVS
jgi:hypothetical protein